MMSMHKSNIPFYVLKIQKYVNLRKICPSRGVVGFSEFRGEDLTRGKEKIVVVKRQVTRVNNHVLFISSNFRFLVV